MSLQAGKSTLPSSSSFISGVFSIFGRKMDGYSPWDLDIFPCRYDFFYYFSPENLLCEKGRQRESSPIHETKHKLWLWHVELMRNELEKVESSIN